MERIAREREDKDLVPAHLIGYSSCICGATLLDSVVPFLDRGQKKAKVVGAAKVPLDVLVGDSWRWTTDYVEAADQERLEAWLIHPDRTDPNGENAAIYCAVPSLGVHWAHEGKNRVQFLRDRGLKHVPANLTLYSYPDPDRIELFTKRLLGRDEVWAVLDRRWVQPIVFPILGVRVLSEYGVAAASRWPQNWPDADAVAEEMYQGVDPSSARPFNCVDLHSLEARRREEARGYEMVDASIHEADGFRFKPSAIVAFAAACLLLVLVGALLRSATGNAISLVGVSALLTLVGTLTCPFLRAGRRTLEFCHQGRPDCEDLSLESPR